MGEPREEVKKQAWLFTWGPKGTEEIGRQRFQAKPELRKGSWPEKVRPHNSQRGPCGCTAPAGYPQVSSPHCRGARTSDRDEAPLPATSFSLHCPSVKRICQTCPSVRVTKLLVSQTNPAVKVAGSLHKPPGPQHRQTRGDKTLSHDPLALTGTVLGFSHTYS